MAIDERKELIQNWLTTRFGQTKFTLKPASSDASFRRYFRVTVDADSWIVMDAPPEHEDTEPFIQIATFLNENRVNVPKIIAKDTENGFLLLSDLGNAPLLSIINKANADGLYRQTIQDLIRLQSCDLTDFPLPKYDAELLHREMSLFPEWYLKRHYDAVIPAYLDGIYDALIHNALEQPQVLVHRDFHSRNLMLCENNTIGIIDFQDAVIGPVTYDLVSLLRDCYISWPEDHIDSWLAHYLVMAKENGLVANVEFSQFKRWFDLMGLQRHLKVLGIFCRLNYRDGKTNYMNDLPLTLKYVIDVSSRYPEFSELTQYLKTLHSESNL
jgi:hypothetical protein